MPHLVCRVMASPVARVISGKGETGRQLIKEVTFALSLRGKRMASVLAHVPPVLGSGQTWSVNHYSCLSPRAPSSPGDLLRSPPMGRRLARAPPAPASHPSPQNESAAAV